MSSTLILYGTLGCHLCEEALQLAAPVAEYAGVTLREVDIAGDDALEEAYALSIPVLERQPQGERLYWPFDRAQVETLLRS
ncbi:glutaredoxin family protein [Alkalilimnicola sp. S0819]|uniref:glutaredoxin family protein n=1 Tax=Alkalilimnicola sp. S0819 TaxID=2613922 RepID=UPI0012623AFA|nr:glutaredoxin family protein [Alkalilimnicola sp. S0819]KAB7619498.1 glutaredoxin family protein [Alkalilimnicola sp. S0819]MPQ17676.1 glutaredoxin family protein [Alkalilimnicola sp. S0819]